MHMMLATMIGLIRALNVNPGSEHRSAMPHQPRRMLALILSTLVVPATTMAADLGAGAYRLPLVEPFAIYRSDKALRVSPDRGLYQLVEVMPSSPGVGLSTRLMIPKVESVAVQDRIIFGKAADGFFVVDTHQPDPQPQVLRSRDEWEAALSNVGVGDPNALKEPDALAAGVSDPVLRPWKYRIARARLGISDDTLSLMVQLLGFALAFVVGLVSPQGKSPMAVAVVLGLIINVVAQIFIAGGGPGAAVGFVAFPLYCILAAALGKGLRLLTFSRRPAA